MDQIFQFAKGSRLSKVVEDATQQFKDDAKLRLARIANGKEPSHKNGAAPRSCKGGRCTSR